LGCGAEEGLDAARLEDRDEKFFMSVLAEKFGMAIMYAVLDSDIESTTGLLFMTVGHTPITKYDFQVVSVALPAFTLKNAPTLLLSVPQNIISLKTFYCTPATCGICGSVYTFPVTPTGGIDKGAPLFYLAFITIVALLQM